MLAGGGSGGHICPNIAVVERLREQGVDLDVHFLVSSRRLDAQLAEKHGLAYTQLPVQPLTSRLRALPGWLLNWRASIGQVRRLIADRAVSAMVATGGFVSGPAVVAAKRTGVPVSLVNLDAVAGKANRFMAGRADCIFSVYELARWPDARRIGMPLRRRSVGRGDQEAAQRELGIEPGRPTLMVCGGSQGAQTINDMMVRLAESGWPDRRWQVMHLSGPADGQRLRQAYQSAAVTAKVVDFCDAVGAAWRAADLAVSRAGAGSVAEALANATPTVFVPYPFHRDQHQSLNAAPLVDLGGAVRLRDQADAQANAQRLRPILTDLMADAAKRRVMAEALAGQQPEDGAQTVARWLADCSGSGRFV